MPLPNKLENKEQEEALLEGILFALAKPLSAPQLAKLSRLSVATVRERLASLAQKSQEQKRGIILAQNGAYYQLTTAPFLEDKIKNLWQKEIKKDLTPPSLETLSIVAYRGPLTKEELEEIRGVNCSLILRHLQTRGLVAKEKGKKIKEIFSAEYWPKKIFPDVDYYFLTIKFLNFLGLSNLTELPHYQHFRSLKDS